MTKFFLGKFFSTILFSVKKFFWRKFFVVKFFVGKIFGGQNFFLRKIYFCQKKPFCQNFFLANIFLAIFFWRNFFGGKIFYCWNFTAINGISSRLSQGPTFKVWWKSGQWQLRYSWYGQMSQGQMLPEQMSLWHLEYVKKGPRNQPLKFGQNRASKSWDIADMDKCCQDKCCNVAWTNIHLFDNCLRLERVSG